MWVITTIRLAITTIRLPITTTIESSTIALYSIDPLIEPSTLTI